MFENLTDKLERSFRILKGEGRITEINVAETLKEIRRALIDADVNYKVAKTFTDQVKANALGQDVLRSVKPGQMMTKIVRDELAQLMGGTAADIRLEGTPAVVLIAGLQGSGKTTFSGKLASWIRSKKGRQVLLVAGDVYRRRPSTSSRCSANRSAWRFTPSRETTIRWRSPKTPSATPDRNPTTSSSSTRRAGWPWTKR